MRYKKYFVKSLIDGNSCEQDFQAEHYRQAGVPYAPAAGMPVLEAFQIVNQMNMTSSAPNSVFYLDRDPKAA